MQGNSYEIIVLEVQRMDFQQQNERLNLRRVAS